MPASDLLNPSPTQYRRITQLCILALSAIVVTGAGVRLTGSGLGCTDWPLCEEGKFVAALEFHPMVEFVNRLITGVVSLAVAAAVLGSMRRQPRRADLTRWSWVLVAGVVAQIIIGAFVTKSDLKYSVVAIHFLVSMVLIWAAVVLNHLAGREDTDQRKRRWPTTAWVGFVLASVVLATGTLVTSAGPHPGARPDTYGTLVPVKRLPVDFRLVTQLHSIVVWVFVLSLVVIAVRSRQDGISAPARFAALRQLLLLAVLQGAVGYAQYFTKVPAYLVAVHIAGATAVWIGTVRWSLASAEIQDTEVSDG